MMLDSMWKGFTQQQKQMFLSKGTTTLGIIFVVSLIVGIVGAVSGNILMIGVGVGLASMAAVAGVGIRRRTLGD